MPARFGPEPVASRRKLLPNVQMCCGHREQSVATAGRRAAMVAGCTICELDSSFSSVGVPGWSFFLFVWNLATGT